MQQPPDPYSSYSPQPSPYQQPQQAYGQSYPPQQSYPAPQPYNYAPPSYAQPAIPTIDPQVRQRRRIAFSRGLIFGLVMGVIVAFWVFYAIAPQIPAIVSGPPLSLLQALPVWVIYYFAGRSGAKAGGKVATGTLTCLWATLWYLLIDLIGFFVIAGYYHDVPTFGGFGLDMTLAFIGVGIGALGASKGVPRTPLPPYNAPFQS